jgi:NADPH:quinone reductase-like Zn-dependent oxidoreductase
LRFRTLDPHTVCLTGYGALIDTADLKAGDALVVPAASSSVGLAAIQIASRVGATPNALPAGARRGRP